MPPARKRPPRRARKTEPKNGARYDAVLIEDLLAKMQIVVERSLDAPTRGEFTAFVEESRALGQDLRDRTDLLHEAFLQTRKEFGARFDGVDKRLDGVDRRLDGVDKRLDGVDKRLDEVQQELRSQRDDATRQAQGAELRALEHRVAVVERHLGI